jgi:hypothetical protein
MALNTHDQEQIRQYLLGKLSDAEQEKIDERLMVEDELFDEFEASKDELVEEYRAGDLGRTEREWFESHYLASAEGRQRYAFALTMDHLAQRQSQPVYVPTPVPRPNVFERIQQFAAAQPWAFGIAASVVLVVLVGIIAIRLNSQTQVHVFEATLTNATVKRGGEEGPPPPTIPLLANTTQLKLHLQLPKNAPANTRYTALLDDRVNTNNVEIVASDADSVTITIPRKQLPKGWYTLQLTATTPNGNVQQLSYPFNIE